MGDHIVRRGVASSGARRSEPRPTTELSKHELQGLIRDHDRTEPVDLVELEPELELGGEAPARLPSASSPRLLAHTLRREPTPDGMPPAARPSTGPRAPVADRDVSTIAMPRLERPASMNLNGIPGPALVSDTEHTRRHRRGASPPRTDFDGERLPLRAAPASTDFDDDEPVKREASAARIDFDDAELLHRRASAASTDFDDEPVQRMASPARTDFDDDELGHRAESPASNDFDDEPIQRMASPAVPRFGDEAPCPAAADDFDAGHPVTDLAFAARERAARQRQAAIASAAIPPTPRIDRDLAGTVSASRHARAPSRPRAPAGRLVRVLPITLAILVAAGAAYLLLHSGL
jgi:hypothetical protein